VKKEGGIKVKLIVDVILIAIYVLIALFYMERIARLSTTDHYAIPRFKVALFYFLLVTVVMTFAISAWFLVGIVIVPILAFLYLWVLEKVNW
jgi:hypothetical protein